MLSLPPYSMPFDLGALTDRPVEVTLKPSKAENAAIADWLGIGAVEYFAAMIRISRSGAELYVYEASFAADVVQACVVTLEPVASQLKGEFARRYYVAAKASARRQLDVKSREVANLDEEEADILVNPIIDAAAPVLEELSLALDPYPRAAGAVFAVPQEEKPESSSPFAALKALKRETDASPQNHSKVVAVRSRKGSAKSREKAKNKTKNRD